MDIASAQGLWHPKTVFLNTASYGLPPDPAWDALQTALDQWRHGKSDWPVWDEATTESRRLFARLVGVPEEWVCVSSTVAGLTGIVAASLPEGSNVLGVDLEFTSALWPWMTHDDRRISVRTVPLKDLVDAIDDSIDLISVSAVQSATGEVADLHAIAERAAEVGARTFIDATQACGWLPLDAARFDYVVCAAYKWLMSPRGTAFMTVRPEHLDSIRPLAANWYAGDDVHTSYYGPPLRLAQSARRLDVSPAWFNWIGTQKALEVIEAIGVDRVRAHNILLATRFTQGLEGRDHDSAIVSVDVSGAAEKLERAGVMAAVRAGSLRASFHIYNTIADVDAALEVLT
jgi:selenocysteine lyase/cysteine desulfurase